MNVYKLDPLADGRWSDFIRRQPHASVFHTPEWLEALRRTYGYASVAYTTSPPSTCLRNGIVLCDVRSWLTGRRLVSVPFADHCEPLLDTSEDRNAIIAELQRSVDRAVWKYVEIRPVSADFSATCRMGTGSSFFFHSLDLQPPMDELFRGFHKNAIQQTIRRAEREALDYEAGTSESLVRTFYGLQLMTRRRHQLPPQPLEWFRSLTACLGDRVSIHIAKKDGLPVAGIVLLRHRDTLVYKYGASNASFHHLGAMPFLFWHAIREGKNAGFRQLDLGRSDTDNAGLITFKDRLGAARSRITYARYPVAADSKLPLQRRLPAASRVLACLPDRLLVTTGRLLYKHIG